ncbi:MAG: nuclear transport factor 2 family protein, partial [Ilumatobacteraceae bacterium]
MEMWELAARESIRDLVARYNANGDSGRFAQVRELFSAEATMDIGDGRVYRGRDEVMTIFTRTKDGTGATSGLTHVRHTTSTHQIDLIDESSATGRLYFAVLTDIGLDHWGRYVDRYTVEGGRWKFASRVVSVDGWSPQSLFAH